MSDPSDLSALEVVLGYHFGNRATLDVALRHSSWLNEHAEAVGGDNERLEFLGDAVLDLVVGHRLMTRFPQLREGELSVTRAQVVSEAGLAEVAASLSLGTWLRLGKGEDKSGGRTKRSILADAFEAVIAAVYLDGGYSAAAEMVERLLAHRIENVEHTGFYDFKTRLQEMALARLKRPPVYKVVAEIGPDHAKQFVVEVWIGDELYARAEGTSKKAADQNAAAAAAFKLEGKGAGTP
ncbi:MAG: ribonuclease III [Myxococcales bacterium]|nr:ribonuclease III [Myxococcales bacterium]